MVVELVIVQSAGVVLTAGVVVVGEVGTAGSRTVTLAAAAPTRREGSGPAGILRSSVSTRW